jgi:hypothetical protein
MSTSFDPWPHAVEIDTTAVDGGVHEALAAYGGPADQR